MPSKLTSEELSRLDAFYDVSDSSIAAPAAVPPAIVPPITRGKQFINIEFVKKLLSYLSQVGIEKIRFTGGEPSLHPQLTDMIRLAANTPGIHQVASPQMVTS